MKTYTTRFLFILLLMVAAFMMGWISGHLNLKTTNESTVDVDDILHRRSLELGYIVDRGIAHRIHDLVPCETQLAEFTLTVRFWEDDREIGRWVQGFARYDGFQFEKFTAEASRPFADSIGDSEVMGSVTFLDLSEFSVTCSMQCQSSSGISYDLVFAAEMDAKSIRNLGPSAKVTWELRKNKKAEQS